MNVKKKQVNKTEEAERHEAKPNILGPEVGFTDLLDHEMLEQAKNESKKKYFPLRPSSAGYCARRLAFDLAEYYGMGSYPKPPLEPSVTRLLSLGHSVEYSALKNLEKLPGIELRYKQQVVSLFQLTSDAAPPVLIEGSLDVILWSDEHKAVLDVKSQKDGFSAAYKTRWDQTLDKYNNMKSLQRIGEAAYYAPDTDALVKELRDDFLIDNILQLNLYALSDFCTSRGVDHAVIYKYNKNDSRHYEIRFKPSINLYYQVEKKFQNVYETVLKTKDPTKVKCDNLLGTIRAAFGCHPQCHDQDALKAYFKTMPKEWPTDISNSEDKYLDLEQKFNSYLALDKPTQDRAQLEEDIVKAMVEQKLKKVKVKGRVYEIKHLKSPTPHFELRRSKL